MHDDTGAIQAAYSEPGTALKHPVSNQSSGPVHAQTSRNGNKAASAVKDLRGASEDKKVLQDMLRRLNMAYDLFEIQAKFEFVEDGNRVHITVRNTATGKVIRRIPPNELVSNFRSLREGLGLVINQAI